MRVEGGAASQRLRSWASGPLTLVVVLTLTRVVRAGDATLAEALFREGRALMDAGDFVNGCPKLAESQRQDPASGTLLALAFCQEKLGRLATAWGTYNSAALRARQEQRADRERAALERASDLEPRLPRLTVVIGPDVARLSGVTVKRGGEVLPGAAWGIATPVDPGEQAIEVSADGRKPWRRSVLMVEAAERRVAVSALETDEPLVPGPPAEQGAPTTRPGEPDRKGGGPLRTVGIVVGGAGLVALGIGSYFGLQAQKLDRDSQADGHCNSIRGCDPTGSELNRDALSSARTSTILFVTGGALAAGGLTLFLVGGANADEDRSALAVRPVFSARFGGALLHGGF